MLNSMRMALEKPLLYKKSEGAFWNDAYISKQMLKAHLDPQFEGASRKRSIDYARESALQQELSITYLFQDYLQMNLEKDFDFGTMIYCDYGVLSTSDRSGSPVGENTHVCFLWSLRGNHRQKFCLLCIGELPGGTWLPDRDKSLDPCFFIMGNMATDSPFLMRKEGVIIFYRIIRYSRVHMYHTSETNFDKSIIHYFTEQEQPGGK